jgi:predicted XRE-type DNA-binding protein
MAQGATEVTEDLELVHGSGNVWRDLGYADADIRRGKTIIAARIIAALDDRGLSTRQAAKATGFAAADFSRVRNADYARFTMDRLIRMLHALDQEIEVAVSVSPQRQERHQSEVGPA